MEIFRGFINKFIENKMAEGIGVLLGEMVKRRQVPICQKKVRLSWRSTMQIALLEIQSVSPAVPILPFPTDITAEKAMKQEKSDQIGQF